MCLCLRHVEADRRSRLSLAQAQPSPRHRQPAVDAAPPVVHSSPFSLSSSSPPPPPPPPPSPPLTPSSSVSFPSSTLLLREESCAPSQLDASVPVIVHKLGLYISGTLYNDCENQSVFLPHLMLDTGAGLTFMEEMLSWLGFCSDDLVSLSSVDIPRSVVADRRPIPFFRL